ncbi:mitochondrial alternative oxidase [Cyanidioschyzon merolae strain 10D]|uniref:Mitochondrial alternative oxidase n=1 Tax=Cyanidioschyzon merolae (strain NIES-3377 / 10D) TaxID=280699 RepID=M1VGU6_CYAM1|nr:mitochondrial alternative oxidase [Cyanidioschyzon merolae strain 10D]BAM79973.1 mitochondrial alternative oxidase [Cyanidioschyzon merolae strain 10D]|eukprot:XP_005536259.1 mitochondrial alternative oxidase [Cyanidioschyzon merolae strain 10D]
MVCAGIVPKVTSIYCRVVGRAVRATGVGDLLARQQGLWRNVPGNAPHLPCRDWSLAGCLSSKSLTTWSATYTARGVRESEPRLPPVGLAAAPLWRTGARALSTQPQPDTSSTTTITDATGRPDETPYQPVRDAPPKSDPNYPWKWHSFLPEHTYKPNLNVDLKRHVQPTGFSDRFAYYTVKFLRFFADAFFQRRYGHRAVVLETVAAVPGMVGGMMLHLQCLRRFRQSGGWIRVLLEEAENERMHLMVYMSIAQPRALERALVILAQAGFFSFYTLLYTISPKTAHRLVGYLEEEAIVSYTEYLKDIDDGRIPNIPAPPIAIDYWQLDPNARLRDVVLATRADEAHHRDVNHLRANLIKAHRGDPAPYAALKHGEVDPSQYGS